MHRIVPLLAVLLLAGCTVPPPGGQSAPPGTPAALPATTTPAAEGEGFAIYLTAEGLSVSQMQRADLAEVQPAATPIIALADILGYHQASHAIELTPAARERLSTPVVPTTGVPFLVCVDRRPVYWGAFWTPLSSASFPGVVIQQPLGSGGDTIRIELGYPSPQFFRGQDPRPAPEILQALEQAGKLD